MVRLFFGLCVVVSAVAFQLSSIGPQQRRVVVSPVAAKAKGFAAAPAPKKKKEATPARLEKERAAAAYDEAKSKGIPEYRVYARSPGTEAWLPVGCVTVPRAETAHQAIFGNLEALTEAAVSAYPMLRKDRIESGGQGLEYGFNLAVFPDEPVTKAIPTKAQASNPVAKWINDITSPLNTGG